MKKIETEITIHGTPEQVWEVLTDFRMYPDWNPFIREASGLIETGTRLELRLHPPGRRPITFRPTVREVVPHHELRWIGHLGPPGLFNAENMFLLEPIDTFQTRLRQSETFRGIFVPIIPNRLFENTRRGFEQMNRALQAVVEEAR